MRVLLVQPRQGTSFGISKIVTTEPLGLESIASPMLERGHDVRILDLKVEKPSRLDEELRKFAPQAVGISCSFTTDVYPTLEVASHVKSNGKDIYVFVGGHHASLLPDDLMTLDVDAVAIGEGEVTGYELIGQLQNGEDPSLVSGVMTHENFNSDNFTPRALMKDINSFPPPARQLTKHLCHHYHMGFDGSLATMETSRGCRFDCNFCSVWVFFERTARVKDPQKALEELADIEEKEVFLTDDIAFVNRKESEKLALLLKNNKINKEFTAETRADLIVKNKDLIKLWREVGLKNIFVGIEKIDDEGLKSVNKRIKATINEEALDFLKTLGIKALATFIVDPEFDDEDFDRLEEYASKNGLIAPTYTILTPLPGTQVYDQRKHELITDNYKMYDLLHAVLPTKLPLERFYHRFANLYNLGHATSKFGPLFVLRFLKNLRGMKLNIAFKVFNLMRMMRTPSSYIEPHLELEKLAASPKPFDDIPGTTTQ
ncbi:MAG: cobalamin-dependent protein [Candidatus Dadabacteria bacterium]|nr:cobalamin-dependent protein [Candidatus Dadabacteria bacterium]